MARLALCIGINGYPGTGMALKGCVNDAQRWAAELARRGYSVAPPLLDTAATRQAMLAAIEAVIGAAVPGDVVVITFSGHGTYVFDTNGDEESDGFDEGLCPFDVADSAGGPIVDDELHRCFAARASGVRLVLIADSCHSGTVNRGAAGNVRPRFLPMDAWLAADRLARVKLRTRARVEQRDILPAFEVAVAGDAKADDDLLLAGCDEGKFDFSADTEIDGVATGAFSHYALQVLATLPPQATYDDWYAALRKHLPSADYDQTPQLKGSAAARQRPVLS